MIYLDYNATTPVRPEVIEAMAACWRDTFGNPQSLHGPGQAARRAVDLARERLRAAVGAGREWEVVFTGSGTEADNLALVGVLRPGDTLLTSPIEHKAVLAAVPEGVATRLLPVNASGVVELPAPNDAPAWAGLFASVRLASLMLGNNETGALQPVADLARAARAAGVPIHVDAVQAFGRVPIDVAALGVDLISLSAHKIQGPKGVGALLYRKGLDLRPLIRGGSHENDTRAGTHNVPGIVGFGVAASLAANEIPAYQAHTARLRDRFRDGVVSGLGSGPTGGVCEVAAAAPRLANTVMLAFPGLDTQTLLIKLDLAGLAAGAGAACSAGGVDPSHVIKAMDLPPTVQKSVVRFSLGVATTDAEIDAAIAIVIDVAHALQARRADLLANMYR